MLTPDFKISQTDSHIVVVIRVPYVKISACQFWIEESLFKFYLKPYILSLSFEQPLKEMEEPEKATYYHEKHLLEVTLAKKNKGQFFENLNLLSNLLSNKNKQSQKEKSKKKVLVQVIGEPEHKKIQGKPSQIYLYAYGFCNNYKGVFKNLQQEVFELFSFNPEEVSIRDRCELSKKIALEDFDENTYLFDKISNFQEIDRITQGKEAEENLRKAIQEFKKNLSEPAEKVREMLDLPTKELIIHKGQEKQILSQLISIAVCYVYELICMEGELSVESARTISKTCAVFNCLVDYSEYNIKHAINDSIRRCVTYSLYKHIDIALKALKIIAQNLNQNFLTFIIVDIRNQFKTEPRYLLNTIYLNDFVTYLLSHKIEKELTEVKSLLTKFEVTEDTLELDIENEEMDASNNNISEDLQDLLAMI